VKNTGERRITSKAAGHKGTESDKQQRSAMLTAASARQLINSQTVFDMSKNTTK